MREDKTTVDRLTTFSDAVFAVIVTIMVLELKAPEQAEFSDLWPLGPTAISYAVSYLFIAIIWINHHYLMRFGLHRRDAGCVRRAARGIRSDMRRAAPPRAA